MGSEAHLEMGSKSGQGCPAAQRRDRDDGVVEGLALRSKRACDGAKFGDTPHQVPTTLA